MIDFATLRLEPTPNQYLVAPQGLTAATPHRLSPQYPWPAAELARRLRAVALGEPRVAVIEEAAGGQILHLVQRSALFRFPDDIHIAIWPLPNGGSTLAVYSRARYGRSDFGVNRRRIDRWLDRLDSQA